MQKGDILFVRSSVKREGVGWPASFSGHSEPATFCGFIIRARPIEKDIIDSDFLVYLLRGNPWREKVVSNAKQSTITNISQDVLSQLLIPLPPLPEQKRIVAILDEAFEGIDRAIANTEKNLTNSRELFESYLNAIFTQKGDEWEKKTLQEISIKFTRGKSKHRPRGDKKLYGGKYPLIQTGDISNAKHRITSYSQTYNELGLAQSAIWPQGTVCIAIVGANVAETAILDLILLLTLNLIIHIHAFPYSEQ